MQTSTPAPFKVHTALRIDAMALSPDLKTFYLIDAGRLIDFPLDTSSGLVIGEVFGRLSFAAQLRSSVNGSSAAAPINEPALVKAVAAELAAESSVELPTENSIWSIQYIPTTKVFSIVGSVDIDFYINKDNTDKTPADIKPKTVIVEAPGNRIILRYLNSGFKITGKDIFVTQDQVLS